MKIIVDQMPEKAEKCKFHGAKDFESKHYICNVTCKVCPLEEGNSCRVLKTFIEMCTHYRL